MPSALEFLRSCYVVQGPRIADEDLTVSGATTHGPDG